MNDSAQVLVVANVTVDETYAVLSTPKPGESLIGEFRSRDVGGKGANVATVLARCGIATRLMAGIGGDERGEFVRQELSQEGMQSDLVTVLQYPTDLSLIYTDAQGENSIVTTVAATQGIDCSLARSAMESLKKPGFLVLQGNLNEVTTRRLIDDARSLGISIVLNPSPCRDWHKETLRLADILVLNEGEAETLSGLSDAAAVEYLLRQGPRQVVLTRGGDGAMLGSHTRAVTTVHEVAMESVGISAAQELTIETVDAVSQHGFPQPDIVVSHFCGRTYLSYLAVSRSAELRRRGISRAHASCISGLASAIDANTVGHIGSEVNGFGSGKGGIT